MKRMVGLLGWSILIGAAISVAAQEPSLDEVLDRHARAMGFSRDHLLTRAIHMKGTVEGLGLRGRIESWSEAPLYTWSRLELGPLTLETGYDGTEGWVMDRNGSVRRAEGSEEVNAQLESLVNTGAYLLRRPPLPLRRRLVEPDSLGRTRLSLELMGAAPEILTLDAKTWRLAESSWDSGQMELRTVYEDYRPVEGVWMPSVMRMEMGRDMRLTARLESVELTPPRGREAYRRPAAPSSGVIFHGGRTSGWLEMAGKGDHILLHGVVDRGHEGLFLLDTGAGGSILDRARLHALGLSAQGTLEATGAAGTTAAQLVEIDHLELGRAEFPHQSWVTVDLGGIAPLLGADEVLGVLGYDTLRLVVVDIDYENRRVRLIDREGFRPPAGAQEFALRMDANVPTIEVEIEGIAAWVHVDTGSNDTLDLTAPFVEKHRLLERGGRGKLEDAGVQGVGGVSHAQRGALKSLRLGRFTFDDLPVNFNEAGEGLFSSTEVAGVLGAGVLSRFHLRLDYSARRLWLEPNRRYHDPGR